MCLIHVSTNDISKITLSSKVGLMANNKIDTGVDKIGLAEGEVNFLKCTCIFSWQREEKLLLRLPLSG